MGILETMSYGKPVLATKVGGIAEFMKNGSTGYLLPLGEVDLFAKKLKEMSLDYDLVNKMGEEARRVVSQSFSSKQIVEKYLAYYKIVINQRK